MKNHPLAANKIDLVLIDEKKKGTYHVVGSDVPMNHSVKKKKEKYLDLARELKHLWNVKVMVMVIPIVVWALGTVPSNL